MQLTEIIHNSKKENNRKQRNYTLLKYTLLESCIIFIALVSTAMIFSMFNSLAIPVSTSTGNVISFEATQSVAFSDLLGAVIVIAFCTTILTSFVRKMIRNSSEPAQLK